MSQEIEFDAAAIEKIEKVYLPSLEEIDADDTMALQKLAVPVLKKKNLEESIALGKRIEAGRMPDGKLNEDALAAREELMFSCSALNYHMAKRYQGRGVPLSDLFQNGFIALQTAAEKYDWRKGYVFNTYAYQWLRQSNERAMAEESGLPDHMYHISNRAIRLINLFQEKRGRQPTKDELGRMTDSDENGVQNILSALRVRFPNTFSDVEAKMQDDEHGNRSLEDEVADQEAVFGESADDIIDLQSAKEAVWKEISALKPAQQKVLKLRLGIDENGEWSSIGLTFEDTGKKLNLTRERIRQIQTIALCRFKDPDLKLALMKYLSPKPEYSWT